MSLLHRDRTDDAVDTRLGDERLMGDPPVGGPASVEPDEVNDDRERDLVVDRERDLVVDRDRDLVVERTSRSETFGLIARTVVFTLAVVAVVGLALANPDDIVFDLEFEQYTTPMWAVITISAALGAIAGLMVRTRGPRTATTLRR